MNYTWYRVIHYYNTLKGCDNIFHAIFLADLSNFWLSVLTADKASEDISTLGPFSLLSGNVYCKKKRINL
jgi:hypothetical protein